jgi:hypothetical protein
MVYESQQKVFQTEHIIDPSIISGQGGHDILMPPPAIP